MNLLFCINGGYTGPLLDCLDSIVLHGGEKHYDVYLLSSDLAEETQQQLCRQVPAAVALHFISVPRELFEDFPETDRYPQEIYYRLAAPLLLPPELDRILYLDADIVVINPLGPLYRSDFEGSLFMACTHTREFLTRANSHRLGLEEPVPYINTGVILMELNGLRQTIDLSAVRQYALEHFDALLLPDQDILTALYGSRVKLLDSQRYNLSDRILAFYNANPLHPRHSLEWVRQNTIIIHYCGRNKPWKPGYVGILDVFYRELKEQQTHLHPEENQ